MDEIKSGRWKENAYYRKLFREQVCYSYKTTTGETGQHCYQRRTGQIYTPKLAKHFTPDELIEDCIDGLEVYAIRARTLIDKAIALGREGKTMYILSELNHQLGNRKLQTKFHWVEESTYAENRGHFPKVSRKEKSAIQQAFGFLWDYVQSTLPGPSKTDTLYLAYALELDVPLVTDDQDMTDLANEFEASVMSTLQLLKLMLDCQHIRLEIIAGLFEYWKYPSDMPANFHADRGRLFPGLKEL